VNFKSYSKHNIWELQLSNGNLNMNDKIRAAQIWCRNKVAWKLFFWKPGEHGADTSRHIWRSQSWRIL